MAKIKRFFECLVPVSVCNLECPYCYIIQEDRRKMALADMPYSPEHIARALRPERVGGTCFISICGAGETLAQKEVVPIVGELLKEGHFVNITTNGTLSRRFDELIEACGENIGHLHLSFSMHYTELLRKGWVVFRQHPENARRRGVHSVTAEPVRRVCSLHRGNSAAVHGKGGGVPSGSADER